MKSRTLSRGVSSIHGFVLLEALVALLVFSLGVLGVIGLQASMGQAQATARFRADAAYLTTEAIGLMWTDTANLTQFTTANCAAYVPCNDWKTKVASGLPNGTVDVTVDAATGDVNVTVGWTQQGGEAHQYSAATTVSAGK